MGKSFRGVSLRVSNGGRVLLRTETLYKPKVEFRIYTYIYLQQVQPYNPHSNSKPLATGLFYRPIIIAD